MTTLLDQQRVFRASLLAETCPQALLAAGRTPVEARFAIYANAYRGRMVAALRDNYPVLAAALGDEAFANLGVDYLRAHPSRHPSIRWFGDALYDFVTREPEALPHPALADLIRMEWAVRHAFDAADCAMSDLRQLAAYPPDHWPSLRFAVHPSVSVLTLEWLIEPLWHQLQADPDTESEAPERSAHALLVWRHGLAVQFRSLGGPEAKLLDALGGGETLGFACEHAFPSRPADTAAQDVLHTLSALIQQGVLILQGE
ncbi:DNA-binding domain-containing protein [Niveibacterium microcysteis]|uniref:DNA-binding domain-containing protein n=1 Tax=Niveibacterium microcysteis TaxID=2811415 RepID=A0ABX7MB64_9RHOO|nr:DNA-binding domain-containing protein [Niveibacterium microcysteis]QSI78967.1 putative DNA-binding domain-containing protein [Niveibacterium microcysteis]